MLHITTGRAKPAGNFGSISINAVGPPVETPIATIFRSTAAEKTGIGNIAAAARLGEIVVTTLDAATDWVAGAWSRPEKTA